VAANSDTRNVIIRLGARLPVEVIPESATPEDFLIRPVAPRESRQPKTIVWMGGLLPRKGVTLALRVLSKTPQEFNMLILGDGPEMAKARRYAAKLGIDDRVRFLGHVTWSEVQRHLDECVAFLFTSIRDTFGAQLLEAAARGTPIVAIRHQGVADFVPSDAGVLVEPRDIDALADAMAAGIAELSADQEKWYRASNAARKFAESRRLDALLDHFQSVYESLVSIERRRYGSE
jgi:glycosyltransferase involved in cell wall biosynthesis